MPKKSIIILVALFIFLTFFNSLFNPFIGDDKVIFQGNEFYYNVSNVKKIVSHDFLSRYEDFDAASLSGQPSFSGFVSYRPITALTFFLDAALWKSNVIGYRLTNIFLHFIVCLLVFVLANKLLKSTAIAFLATLLFGLHPIQAELINSISYRSDLTSALFSLITFLLFISSKERRTLWRSLGIIVFFSLAVFSKETAITLPIIMIAYDLLLSPKGNIKQEFLKQKNLYAELILIAGFFLYVYYYVFPNSSLGTIKIFSSFLVQARIVVVVFAQYLYALIFPNFTIILPVLYWPNIESLPLREITVVGVFLLLCVLVIFRFFKGNRVIPFFMLWFFVSFAPISNIIPLPNPMAYRFLYFPSIGFFIIVAFIVDKFCVRLKNRFPTMRFSEIIKITLIASYMVMSFSLNALYASHLSTSSEMIRNFPDAKRAYWIRGLAYLELQKYSQAREDFKTYLQLIEKNPYVKIMNQDYFIYHQWGRCFIDDPDSAIEKFKKAITLRPDYFSAYVDLSQAHVFKKDYSQALYYALLSIKLQAHPLGYYWAVFNSIELGNVDRAYEFLEQGRDHFPKFTQFDALEAQLDKIIKVLGVP